MIGIVVSWDFDVQLVILAAFATVSPFEASSFILDWQFGVFLFSKDRAGWRSLPPQYSKSNPAVQSTHEIP